MDETKKGFMQNIGDLSFKKIDETNYEFSIKVEEKFLNTGKIAHGGFIATIADTGMGNAAHIAAGNKRSVTVNLDIKYISAGKLGDNLVGKEVESRIEELHEQNPMLGHRGCRLGISFPEIYEMQCKAIFEALAYLKKHKIKISFQ